MSNIYIQEPPTRGKVLLTTSVGEIEVELWSKEAPKACRNFVQLCMEGYYNGTIFHRVVKDFIVQGGDPTGTGHGGESIYGKTFKDEFHSRLRFVRRGLLAMANSSAHDNGSQFFFTFAAAPELHNKHTLFAKVAGDTIYNMLKLADCETDSDEKPLYPHKIIKTEILSNPFDDIVPRELTPKDPSADDGSRKIKSQSKATKNFSLLSFGEEAEEDEEEVTVATELMRHRGKSSHDLLDDDRLSVIPAVIVEDDKDDEDVPMATTKRPRDDQSGQDEDDTGGEQTRERIRKKLKKTDPPKIDRKNDEKKEKREKKGKEDKEDDDDGEDGEMKPYSKEDVSSRNIEDLQKEAALLKRQIRESMKATKSRKKDDLTTKDGPDAPQDGAGPDDGTAPPPSDLKDYQRHQKSQLKKGSGRQEATLAILAQFQSKLNAARLLQQYNDDDEDDAKTADAKTADDEDDDDNDMSWMGHTLKFDIRDAKVKDANVDDAERYEISDPRNPITKRRREASKQAMKKRK